jgi:hypothetical protein
MKEIRNIRNDDHIIKVYLNSDDEFIELDTSDSTFLTRFADFTKWLEDIDAELQGKADEAEKKFEGRPMFEQDEDGEVTSFDTEQFMLLTDIWTDSCRRCVERLETLFGAGVCRKYFKKSYEINPDFVPNEDEINELIEALSDVVLKAFGARKEQIGKKYNKGRKGRRKTNE